MIKIKGAATNARQVMRDLYNMRRTADMYGWNDAEKNISLPDASQIVRAFSCLKNAGINKNMATFFNTQQMDYLDKRLLEAEASIQINSTKNITELLKLFNDLSQSPLNRRRHFKFFSGLPQSMLTVILAAQRQANLLLKNNHYSVNKRLQYLKLVNENLYKPEHRRQLSDDFSWGLRHSCLIREIATLTKKIENGRLDPIRSLK